MSDTPNLKNIKNIAGGGAAYNVRGEDDVINIDTSVGSKEIYIPNIYSGKLQMFYKSIYVNDIGGAASTNPIRIYALNGDTINGSPFVDINLDGGSCEIVVSGNTTWIANFGTSSSPLDADDKVKVSATDVLTQYLGEKLIQGANIQLDIIPLLGVEYLQIAATSLPLLVENTLFVSKNGNDATGTRNDWSKPFATILAASNAALAGDVVYVFSGIYDQGLTDCFKSDIIYYLSRGVNVRSTYRSLSDFGIAKNLIILGEGDFTVTNLNFSYGCINLDNPATTLFLRCNNINGIANGVQILNAASFDIEFVNCSAPSQYGLSLRGNSQGTVKWTGLLNANIPAIFRNLGTDLVSRSIDVFGYKSNGQASAFNGSDYYGFNCNNTTINLSNITNQHTGGVTGGLFTTDSGSWLLRNVISVGGVGYGASPYGTSKVRFENCYFKSLTYALFLSNSAQVETEASQFISDVPSASSTGTVVLTGTSELDFSNSVAVQTDPLGNACILDIRNNNFRTRNSKFVGNASITESFRNTAALPITIWVELQCATNKAIQGLFTNGIFGTNIIVDPNVKFNTTPFIK